MKIRFWQSPGKLFKIFFSGRFNIPVKAENNGAKQSRVNILFFLSACIAEPEREKKSGK